MDREGSVNKSPKIKITSVQSTEAALRDMELVSTSQHDEHRDGDGDDDMFAPNCGSGNSGGAAGTVCVEMMPPSKPGGQADNRASLMAGPGERCASDDNTASAGDAETTHAYTTRWFVLAIFCSHSAINSFQWIQYSSITNIVSKYYNVTNQEVNLTSLVYMITYIPFIVHASLMLERIGLRRAVCLGAVGTAAGSLLKLSLGGGNTRASFWAMMAGQTVVALSQLYIISIPPLLAAVWFPDHQVSTATGIGVFGNQLGIALGFIVPPLLLSEQSQDSHTIGHELRSLEAGIALISIAVFLVAILFLKDRPPKPPGSASLHAAKQHNCAAIASPAVNVAAANRHQQQHVTISTNGATNSTSSTSSSSSNNNNNNNNNNNTSAANNETFASIKQLCRERDFQLLTLSYGINVGCFYAVSTVLNQMIAKTWPNPDELAGTMGLLIVISGMLGSIVCGQLLDRTHAFKLIIVLIYLMSLVSMLSFTLVVRLLTSAWSLYGASVLLGFFMTGYLPLGFEFAAEITYPHPANTPAGLLNLSAQIFGLVLTYASSIIVDKENGDLWANLFLNTCLAVGLTLTAIMKADLRRQKAVAEEQMKL